MAEVIVHNLGNLFTTGRADRGPTDRRRPGPQPEG